MYDEKFGVPDDKTLSKAHKVLAAKAEYIYRHGSILRTDSYVWFRAIILGLISAYKRQTLLGFISVILGILAVAL